MIRRNLKEKIEKSLSFFPAVAILGPRQSGKTTLAKQVLESYPDSIYLDLEKAVDRKKLEDPAFYLGQNKDKLICLDEIQRVPELFPEMRSMIDEQRVPARFLILGSASQDLIRQSSETLAGRISYHELNPLALSEIDQTQMIHHWICGGYPDSFLSPEIEFSIEWRDNFIRTFLERDIASLGFNLSPEQLGRFWTMIAHQHSSVLNRQIYAESLSVSSPTIQRWIDIFSNTFMVRSLLPYSNNSKKRLVKSPKLYIRDSGLLHQLLGIESFDDLMGHPISGPSWEGYAIENILTEMKGWESSFYRTKNGVELDLVISKGGKKYGLEFKLSSSPKIERGNHIAREDLDLETIHIITPEGSGEQINQHICIDSPLTFLEKAL
jgi:predicted AAA+ superfamily ATPase